MPMLFGCQTHVYWIAKMKGFGLKTCVLVSFVTGLLSRVFRIYRNAEAIRRTQRGAVASSGGRKAPDQQPLGGQIEAALRGITR